MSKKIIKKSKNDLAIIKKKKSKKKGIDLKNNTNFKYIISILLVGIVITIATLSLFALFFSKGDKLEDNTRIYNQKRIDSLETALQMKNKEISDDLNKIKKHLSLENNQIVEDSSTSNGEKYSDRIDKAIQKASKYYKTKKFNKEINDSIYKELKNLYSVPNLTPSQNAALSSYIYLIQSFDKKNSE